MPRIATHVHDRCRTKAGEGQRADGQRPVSAGERNSGSMNFFFCGPEAGQPNANRETAPDDGQP